MRAINITGVIPRMWMAHNQRKEITRRYQEAQELGYTEGSENTQTEW